MTTAVQRKARAVRRNAERAQAHGHKPPEIRLCRVQKPHLTALAWLHGEGHITSRQRVTGEAYGADYRAATMDPDTLPSCLSMPEVHGGQGGAIPRTSHENALWIATAGARLTAKRIRVHFQHDAITALDGICGRNLRPREIMPVQRDAERLVMALRMALDQLAGMDDRPHKPLDAITRTCV